MRIQTVGSDLNGENRMPVGSVIYESREQSPEVVNYFVGVAVGKYEIRTSANAY